MHKMIVGLDYKKRFGVHWKKKFEDDKKKQAVAAEVKKKKAEEAKEEWKFWKSGNLVKTEVRIASEEFEELYGQKLTVVGNIGEKLRVSQKGIEADSFEVELKQVEVVRHCQGRELRKHWRFAKHEYDELLYKFEHLAQGNLADKVEGDTMLTGEQVMFLGYLYQMELKQVVGSALVNPDIVDGVLGKGFVSVMQEGSLAIVLRKLRLKALVGFPIRDEVHWVLLVLRRGADTVWRSSYYDSGKGSYRKCYDHAVWLIKLFNLESLKASSPVSGMEFEQLPPFQDRKTNRVSQENGYDCGVYAMHYWKLELLRFDNLGTVIKFPTVKNPRRQALCN